VGSTTFRFNPTTFFPPEIQVSQSGFSTAIYRCTRKSSLPDPHLFQYFRTIKPFWCLYRFFGLSCKHLLFVIKSTRYLHHVTEKEYSKKVNNCHQCWCGSSNKIFANQIPHVEVKSLVSNWLSQFIINKSQSRFVSVNWVICIQKLFVKCGKHSWVLIMAGSAIH